MSTKAPKKYPMNGPGKQDQGTMIAYWIKPQESLRLHRMWSQKQGGR